MSLVSVIGRVELYLAERCTSVARSNAENYPPLCLSLEDFLIFYLFLYLFIGFYWYKILVNSGDHPPSPHTISRTLPSHLRFTLHTPYCIPVLQPLYAVDILLEPFWNNFVFSFTIKLWNTWARTSRTFSARVYSCKLKKREICVVDLKGHFRVWRSNKTNIHVFPCKCRALETCSEDLVATLLAVGHSLMACFLPVLSYDNKRKLRAKDHFVLHKIHVIF